MCRHAELYAQWVRLRPLMNGTAQPDAYSLTGPGQLPEPVDEEAQEAEEAPASASNPASPSLVPFRDGPINTDLLQYLSADVEAMDRPDYDPPPPPLHDFPPPRGFHGAGPPPPPRAKPVPAPVRCRGPEESPLPEEVARTDVWHERTKTGQASPRRAGPERPESADTGAVRVSQAAVKRLQAAKEWSQTRQAEVRRTLRSARGLQSPDYVWGPGDPPSDPAAEARAEADAEDDDDCDVESVMSSATGLTCSTSRSYSTWERPGAGEASSGSPAGPRDAARSRRSPRPAHAPGTGTQTAPRFWEPSEKEAAAATRRARAAVEAEELRQRVLSGNAKSREQTRGTYDHYHNLTHGTEADKALAYTFDPKQPAASTDAGDAVWKRLRYGWYGRDDIPDPAAQDDGGDELDPSKPHGGQLPELQTVEVSKRKGLEEYGLGTGVISGFGIVDYETAMARRRAISAALTAHETGRDLNRGEVLDLFITFCNLANRSEMLGALKRALTAPLSAAAVASAAEVAAARRISGASGLGSVGTTPRGPDGEEAKQRIRVIAWLLGVTWRRITNETYASFVCRVLGWPPELAAGLPRTRATAVIARALVRGHLLADIPPPAPRH
ncbi:hypothetical protein GPECTOR_6g682 [Gonium pectorale]|uniref:Uncharacterized protein n=1 Tax=Gonium pectorale TaxID=33097 RepID=A0A150GVE3_GONPE|nr:hypothetical protein GPECTOR_6g682 [Gonium pectorale]|eukprot:KXZ53764.1 hypothetical protein GPECTOR_6g682 [Gonium pectorale]